MEKKIQKGVETEKNNEIWNFTQIYLLYVIMDTTCFKIAHLKAFENRKN